MPVRFPEPIEPGIVPVPGSDELLEGDMVNEGPVDTGAVSVPGRVELNPGEAGEDGDTIDVGAVPMLGVNELYRGYDGRYGVSDGAPPVGKVVEFPIGVVEIVPILEPELEEIGVVPVPESDVLRLG